MYGLYVAKTYMAGKSRQVSNVAEAQGDTRVEWQNVIYSAKKFSRHLGVFEPVTPIKYGPKYDKYL